MKLMNKVVGMFFNGLGILAVLGLLAIPCLIVYTVVHFILKFW